MLLCKLRKKSLINKQAKTCAKYSLAMYDIRFCMLNLISIIIYFNETSTVLNIYLPFHNIDSLPFWRGHYQLSLQLSLQLTLRTTHFFLLIPNISLHYLYLHYCMHFSFSATLFRHNAKQTS